MQVTFDGSSNWQRNFYNIKGFSVGRHNILPYSLHKWRIRTELRIWLSTRGWRNAARGAWRSCKRSQFHRCAYRANNLSTHKLQLFKYFPPRERLEVYARSMHVIARANFTVLEFIWKWKKLRLLYWILLQMPIIVAKKKSKSSRF